MFQSDNPDLVEFFERSSSVDASTFVTAEWNMNIPGNIQKIGNYRYRKNSTQFGSIPNLFDLSDNGNFYTGATDADIVVDSGFVSQDDTPIAFAYPKQKEALYYSIEDCIKPNRPRSGINKLSYFSNKFLPHPNKDMFKRPRYYMSSKNDEFKYWRSYRTESFNGVTTEYGISKNASAPPYLIDDAAPFVVYKEPVPANKLVFKVQTNVGDVNLGPFRSPSGEFTPDPFFGDNKKTVPVDFRIQYLDQNNRWLDAITFNSLSVRDDGISPIFGSDGYLALEYGLITPFKYKDSFVYNGELNNTLALPANPNFGDAWFAKLGAGNSRGILLVWNGNDYDEILPEYGWTLANLENTGDGEKFVNDVTNPDFFQQTETAATVYREFVLVKGLRVVVNSMNTPNTPFELIEMSSRLVVNLTSLVADFDIAKVLSDVSSSALPVGQLTAGTGTLNLFDTEEAFNEENSLFDGGTSLVAKYLKKNIKFNFYEVVSNVNNRTYYIPIKSLYSEGIPQLSGDRGNISIPLRDYYYYFESITAPSILLTEVSLTQAICLLLDSIGFSNYVIKRLQDEKEIIIPYFFVAPDQNVAEVLQELAVATQSAMFFDEYNNFVIMTKGYLLDDTGDRPIDLLLRSTPELVPTNDGRQNVLALPNIISLASQDKKIYNAGQIDYTQRYIQRSYGTLDEAATVDKEYVYKPSLLWEVSGTEKTTSANSQQQGKFTLGAYPLNSDLPAVAPTVSNGQIINNIFDVGENAYWITRYKGFLYSDGEIIKYDAVEFSITGTGNVWISDNLEYQRYFASLPFNGKIYPTGKMRIYCEPFYETKDGLLKLKNGAVVSHGRGQFGTPIVEHKAGIDPYWTSLENVQGCDMNSEYLFSTDVSDFYFSVITESVGTTFKTLSIQNLKVGQTITMYQGTGVLATSAKTKITAINEIKDEETSEYSFTVSIAPTTPLSNSIIRVTTLPGTVAGPAGLNKVKSEKSQRNGIIKNFLSTKLSSETDVGSLRTTRSGTIQSSALVFSGPTFNSGEKERDFLSYVYRPINKAFKHFGTRLRIVGKTESAGEADQAPVGGMTYLNLESVDPTKTVTLGGGSGGISLVDPTTNNGYYFELAAFTSNKLDQYLKKDENGEPTVSIQNMMFYKVQKNADDPNSSKAVPVKLWGGLGNVTVDDGSFAGQYRFSGEQNPTVYDLAIEYIDLNEATRIFYLYINQKLIQRVVDTSPLKFSSPSIGLFVRGTSKLMFENVYALGKNYASNAVFDTKTPIAAIFGDENNEVNASEALNRYAMSGAIQKTYLSGVNPSGVPNYDIYFEEFGSVFRECAYFNIKYDRSYPALYAKIAPTFNRLKGYTVSGFTADSYGAEFLIFNNTDTLLNLDETTGNYLRIQGVTFTQDTTSKITVDDYLKRRGNLSDPELKGSTIIQSPYTALEQYDKIKTSRLLYGKNEFSLKSDYIQDQDAAEDLLEWLIDKNLEPRKLIGVNIFPTPTIQLGDIVNILYNIGGVNLTNFETRFVVYSINYGRSLDGPTMTLYLSEI